MRKLIVIIAVLIHYPGTIFAIKSEEKHTEIIGKVINYGIASRTDKKTINQPETTSGYRVVSDDAAIVEKTTLVPCEKNIGFLFRYEVTGVKPNSEIVMKKVVIHPPMKKPDGSISTGYETTNIEESDSDGNIEGATGYVLNREYEFVPGKWKFTMFYKNILVVEQTFEVVKGGKCT